MICKETLFSDHAINQMFKRNISVDDVKFIVGNGETIMTDLNDRPHPSYFILGYVDSRPIHVVVGKDDILERCIIVATCEPDASIWEAGFKLKRQ